MADQNLKVEIVSPERLVMGASADSVTVPGADGYFTVMGDHAPLMTTLKPGFVTVTEGGTAKTFYVRGGFADVSPEGLTILAEDAKTAADFERSHIEAEIKTAQETLAAIEDTDQKGSAQAALDGWMNLMLEAEHLEGTVH